MNSWTKIAFKYSHALITNCQLNPYKHLLLASPVVHHTPSVLSPEMHLEHFYTLGFFLFSLHSEADQIGAAPITCQRNVPALPSITTLTTAGSAVAYSSPPTFPEGSSAFAWWVDWDARVCVGARLSARRFTRHQRSLWFRHVTRHVLPCSAAYMMSAA